MWKYLLELTVKSDDIKEIITQLERILAELKAGKRSEEHSYSDKVEYEWEVRG
jgi:hypothetical protein